MDTCLYLFTFNIYFHFVKVGHDLNGKINGILVTYYGDHGCYGNELNRISILRTYMDNGNSNFPFDQHTYNEINLVPLKDT